MKNTSGIEFRECPGLDFEYLPGKMYEGVSKQWSDIAVCFPQELISELQVIVQQYLRVMGLDATKYPARVDLGFSEKLEPIIYEITTGFVDQVGSCIALQQELGDTVGMEALSGVPFTSSVLTSNPYKPEYNLMREMFDRAGKILGEGESESTFVYGYPTEVMKGKTNFIPGWKGLASEEKSSQVKILSRIVSGSKYIVPRSFGEGDTGYEDLPRDQNTQLIFKQNVPKIKGDRNTIIFGKGKQVRDRYESGDMLAQEYIPAYRDKENRRFEAKVLFMPGEQGSNFMGMYNLVDGGVMSQNFGNMNIPNDGYPQGPGIIIS